MIKTQEQLSQEAAQEAEDFAAVIAESEQESTGIRRPPKIDVTEVALDTVPFEIDLGSEDSAKSLGGGGGGGGPIEETTGACCADDGTCDDEHGETFCDDSGGTWQGDGTDCGSITCPEPTGACCDGSDCTITDLASCSGVYQGDGTMCSPNPCVPCCGGCGYVDSGHTYLTKTRTQTCNDGGLSPCSYEFICCYPNTGGVLNVYDQVCTIDPSTCVETCGNGDLACTLSICNEKHSPFVPPDDCSDSSSHGCTEGFAGHSFNLPTYSDECNTSC